LLQLPTHKPRQKQQPVKQKTKQNEGEGSAKKLVLPKLETLNWLILKPSAS